jgi:1,4-alpha-glucan branching enzyme
VLQEFPEARFFIVGDGPYRRELEYLAHELGVAHRVVFTGFVTDNDRNRILAEACVAVFPSLYEPFGIVALEAMAAGTPVVAADVGGLGDVVDHGRNGLKMLPGDAYSCAVQVGALLRDRAFAHNLASTARAEIGRYDWNRIAAQTADIYTGILAHKDYLKITTEDGRTGDCDEVVNSAGKNS